MSDIQHRKHAQAVQLLGPSAYVATIRVTTDKGTHEYLAIGRIVHGRDERIATGSTWGELLEAARDFAIRPPSAGKSLRNGEKR